MTLHAVEPSRSELTRDAFERILSVWRSRLRLTYWIIEIQWDEPLDDDEANAEVRYDEDYDTAKIRLAAGCISWSPEWANKVMVHELLHIVARDMDEHVKAARLVMPPPAHKLFANRYEHEAEGVVDRLASILVDQIGVA